MNKNINSINFQDYSSESDKKIIKPKRIGSVSDAQRRHFYIKKELLTINLIDLKKLLSEVLKKIYKTKFDLFEQELGFSNISNINSQTNKIILTKKWINDKTIGIELFISSKSSVQWTSFEIKKHWLFKKGSILSLHEKLVLDDASEKMSYDGLYRTNSIRLTFKKKFKYIIDEISKLETKKQ